MMVAKLLIALGALDFCDGTRAVKVDVDQAELASKSDKSGFWDTAMYVKDMLTLKSKGYRGAFCNSGPCPETLSEYPGKRVDNILSHDGVVAEMRKSATKQRNNELIKGNDLGYLILNQDLWEGDGEYESISLGASIEMHAFLRPLLDATVGSQGEWSYEEFLASARDFWAKQTSILTSGDDAAKWNTRTMHKHHFNMELSDDEVSEFVGFQGKTTMGVVLPIGQSFALPSKDDRTKWLMKYMAAIQEDARSIFPEEVKEVQLRGTDGNLKAHDEMNFDCEADWKTPPCKLHFIAAGLMDSMLFAGGLSVRQGLQVGMNLLYSTDFQNDYYDGVEEFRPVGGGIKEDDVEAFVYELYRLFPGVVGFPWWSPGYDANKKGGSTKTHRTIMNIALALRDEKKWQGTPVDKFSVKRAAEMGGTEKLKEAMSVAWAGPANHDPTSAGGPAPGTMARGCPGQSMSVNIVNAFFAAFSEVCEDFVVAYVGEEGEGGIKLMDAVPFVDTGATLHRVIRQGELRMGMNGKDSFDDAYVYLEPATSNGPAKLRVYGSKAARVMDHPDQGAMVWDLEKSAARCYAVAKDTEDSKCFMLKGIVPWGPWGGREYSRNYFCASEEPARDEWVEGLAAVLPEECVSALP